MAEETGSNTSEAKAGEAPPRKIVDFDANEGLGTDEIELKRPFKFGGVVYTRISFREPTGADVEKFLNGKGTVDSWALFTALTGVPVLALQQMYAGDYSALDRAVGKHL
jgi:hypothetical protein